MKSKKKTILKVVIIFIILFFLPTIIGIGHCIWNENRFFGDRFHLSGIYMEAGVEIDDWKVHCVYEDEDGLTFEMISWNEWQVPMLIANRRNACTYVYSVQEACREEVNLLNEEYANRISIRNEDQDYSRSSSIYPLGVTEEEAWAYLYEKYPHLLDIVFPVGFNHEYALYYAENPDTVGYIKIGGTVIDTPVVQADNNKYYLTHSFDKSFFKSLSAHTITNII